MLIFVDDKPDQSGSLSDVVDRSPMIVLIQKQFRYLIKALTFGILSPEVLGLYMAYNLIIFFLTIQKMVGMLLPIFGSCLVDRRIFNAHNHVR